jgi:hypothetical protein
MQRALASIALFVLASFCAACGGGDNANNANVSGPFPIKTDRITVEYPNLFLQGGEAAQGKVTCELEEIPGVVLPYETTNGNTTRAVDRPDVHIRPRDAERYDTYVEIKLLPEGLDKVNPPDSKQLYDGDKKLVWEWSLKPVEGKKEGDEVSFHFQVNVTRRAKAGDAPDEEIRDIWRRVFTVKVGPPASRVKAALYGSPLFAAAGFVTFGTSLRRRKLLPVAGEEDEGEVVGREYKGEAVGGEYKGSMGVGGTRIDAAVAEADIEEDVGATVYAPGQAAPGDAFLVQVFVHLPEQAASLEEIAREADEDARRRAAARLQKKIRRGTELAFYLVMPGLDVDEPAQSCVWEGEPACVQFGVTVPEGCKHGSIIGTVTVSENSVPVGHLKFKFKVAGDATASAQAPVAEPEPAGSLVRYRQAFISYASEDRSEVLKRVQMLNLAKIKFFQDLLTLEPGESWERLLYEYIDKSDVFFLFWSRAASESEWVRREVEYAIKAKTDEGETGPEIIPVIIEGPPPARPPAELSFLHFNDKLLYFINSMESRTGPPEGRA